MHWTNSFSSWQEDISRKKNSYSAKHTVFRPKEFTFTTFGAISFASSVVFGRPRLDTCTWCLCEGGGVRRNGEEEGELPVICRKDEINKFYKIINNASPGLSNKCLLSHML